MINPTIIDTDIMNMYSHSSNFWGEYYQMECLLEIVGYLIGFMLAFIKLCIR
jgi:hypothetical protein